MPWGVSRSSFTPYGRVPISENANSKPRSNELQKQPLSIPARAERNLRNSGFHNCADLDGYCGTAASASQLEILTSSVPQCAPNGTKESQENSPNRLKKTHPKGLRKLTQKAHTRKTPHSSACSTTNLPTRAIRLY